MIKLKSLYETKSLKQIINEEVNKYKNEHLNIHHIQILLEDDGIPPEIAKKINDKLKDEKVKNPASGRMIKVTSALEKKHPAYKAAKPIYDKVASEFTDEISAIDNKDNNKKELKTSPSSKDGAKPQKKSKNTNKLESPDSIKKINDIKPKQLKGDASENVVNSTIKDLKTDFDGGTESFKTVNTLIKKINSTNKNEPDHIKRGVNSLVAKLKKTAKTKALKGLESSENKDEIGNNVFSNDVADVNVSYPGGAKDITSLARKLVKNGVKIDKKHLNKLFKKMDDGNITASDETKASFEKIKKTLNKITGNDSIVPKKKNASTKKDTTAHKISNKLKEKRDINSEKVRSEVNEKANELAKNVKEKITPKQAENVVNNNNDFSVSATPEQQASLIQSNPLAIIKIIPKQVDPHVGIKALNDITDLTVKNNEENLNSDDSRKKNSALKKISKNFTYVKNSIGKANGTNTLMNNEQVKTILDLKEKHNIKLDYDTLDYIPQEAIQNMDLDDTETMRVIEHSANSGSDSSADYRIMDTLTSLKSVSNKSMDLIAKQLKTHKPSYSGPEIKRMMVEKMLLSGKDVPKEYEKFAPKDENKSKILSQIKKLQLKAVNSNDTEQISKIEKMVNKLHDKYKK